VCAAFTLQLVPIDEPAERVGHALTMFIAAFALLYVTADYLPKVWQASRCYTFASMVSMASIWLESLYLSRRYGT
jgi:hypothetical protein